MYAVTVGATLPRLEERTLHSNNPLLWALLFMVAVFLEDFYLYHAKVVPEAMGFPHWRGYILTMLIIISWYLSQVAFPSNPRLFLLSFALFFLLKLLGGILLKPTHYPVRQDFLFLFPIVAAFVLAFYSECGFFKSHPGRLLMVLAPIWLLTVVLWWAIDAACAAGCGAGGVVRPAPPPTP